MTGLWTIRAYSIGMLPAKRSGILAESLSGQIVSTGFRRSLRIGYRRRFSIVQETKDDIGRKPNCWPELFNHDGFWSQSLSYDSAGTKYPDQFVRQVLPVILTITDGTVYTGRKKLHQSVTPYGRISSTANMPQLTKHADRHLP